MNGAENATTVVTARLPSGTPAAMGEASLTVTLEWAEYPAAASGDD
jgi:hypothetical protein